MTHGNAGDAPAAARPAGAIVTDPPRAGAEHVDALRGYGVATVHEAMGRTGCLGPGLRPVQRDVRIAGTVVTALCWPGDNLMIHAAVEHCAEGDILVVATTSPSTDGMFGQLFATALHHRGVRGLAIDAGVRDTAELRAMGFPVWSAAVCVQGTVKATAGSVNVPVVVGGQCTGNRCRLSVSADRCGPGRGLRPAELRQPPGRSRPLRRRTGPGRRPGRAGHRCGSRWSTAATTPP